MAKKGSPAAGKMGGCYLGDQDLAADRHGSSPARQQPFQNGGAGRKLAAWQFGPERLVLVGHTQTESLGTAWNALVSHFLLTR